MGGIFLNKQIMIKYVILIQLFMVLVIPKLKSQNESFIYCGDNSSFLSITNDYAEFRFTNIIGGGRVDKLRNRIIIHNDISYSGQSKSYYSFFANDLTAKKGYYEFIVKDENNKTISSKDIVIHALQNKKTLNVAKEIDGHFELLLKEIPYDSIIHVMTYMHYPLKIKLDSLSSGRYHITLTSSSEWLLYMTPAIGDKIVCKNKTHNTIICSRKIPLTRLKSHKTKEVLIRCDD